MSQKAPEHTHSNLVKHQESRHQKRQEQMRETEGSGSAIATVFTTNTMNYLNLKLKTTVFIL